jgi:hypothetical protein
MFCTPGNVIGEIVVGDEHVPPERCIIAVAGAVEIGEQHDDVLVRRRGLSGLVRDAAALEP